MAYRVIVDPAANDRYLAVLVSRLDLKNINAIKLPGVFPGFY
jgi:hypothetical protein